MPWNRRAQPSNIALAAQGDKTATGRIRTGWGGRLRAVTALLALIVAVFSLAPGANANVAPGADAGEALSLSDQRIYRNAFAAAKAGRWRSVHRLVANAENPLPAKVLRWLEMSESGAGASFEDIATFIQQNPDWPRQAMLARRAEEAMTPQTDDSLVLAWFAMRKPVTAQGRIRLAEVMLRRGESDRASRLLRAAWIGGNYTYRRERAFVSRFGKHLRKSDHIARLDRLLWDRKHRQARRVMRRVDAGHRSLAEARLRLMRFSGGVDSAIRNVPEGLRRDLGLQYERLRWRRRKGRTAEAREILLNAPRDLVRPLLWWREREIILRRTLTAGLAADAYRLARDHGQTAGKSFAEAEFLAGWIALRHRNDADAALGHFAALFAAVRYPISRARGAYWAGRAAETGGNLSLAQQWYRRATRYPTTYYGQLAAARARPPLRLRLARDPRPSVAMRKTFRESELVAALRALNQIGQRTLMRSFALRLVDIAAGAGAHVLVGEFAAELDRPDLGVLAARRSVRKDVQLLKHAYPLPAFVKNNGVERALLLGLLRQESGFDTRAVSPAGAAGLMQLMPATARSVARSAKLRYSRTRLLRDPAYNLRIGQAYLSRLVGKYRGSYVMALAAYNGGGRRVGHWVRDHGDPRADGVDVVDWIESIPIAETRDYVQRVLEGVQVYRRRLGLDAFASALVDDLRRAAVPANR